MLPYDIIRILHVDDESTQLKITKLFVEKIDPNMKIISCNSPNEVIYNIEKNIDCIVSDYQMPEINGIDLAKLIRSKTSIPFILYTGRGSEDVAAEAFAVGVDDYVKKEVDPVHYQVLVKSIRTAVEKFWAEDELNDSEKRYRTLVESSPNSILVTIDDEIVYCNGKLAELLCIDDVSTLIGQNPVKYIYEKDRKNALHIFEKLITGEKDACILELRVKNLNSEIISVSTHSSNIEWINRRAQLHILQNIDEIKRYMDENSNLKKELLEIGDLIQAIQDKSGLDELNCILDKVDRLKNIM